jgi:hypothetical protein
MGKQPAELWNDFHEKVRAFEGTYIHLPIRAMNSTNMLFKCQMGSLSESVITNLPRWTSTSSKSNQALTFEMDHR